MFVTAKGMTLYTFDKDTPGKSVCNGKCATNWPPAIAGDGAKPAGDWTIVARGDGMKQWAYKGKPVYAWVKDSKPGDTTGDGFLNGAWHVAKPDKHRDAGADAPAPAPARLIDCGHMADPTSQLEPLIPALRRYAYALVRDHDAADDLVQDTLERALSRWLLRRPDGDLRAWLFTIQRNLFLNAYRQRQRRATHLDSTPSRHRQRLPRRRPGSRCATSSARSTSSRRSRSRCCCWSGSRISRTTRPRACSASRWEPSCPGWRGRASGFARSWRRAAPRCFGE